MRGAEAPQIFVLAGPNGSGKTTWLSDNADEIASLNLVLHLNPDAVAREMNPDNVRQAAGEAGREVIRRTAELLERRESFGFETTLAGHHALRVMHQACNAAYEVTLVFVATENPSINVERVAARRSAGGHDVPAEDILRRYKRSLDNLEAAFTCADRIRLIDNSRYWQPHEFVRFDRDNLTIKRPVPAFGLSAVDWLIKQMQRVSVGERV